MYNLKNTNKYNNKSYYRNKHLKQIDRDREMLTIISDGSLRALIVFLEETNTKLNFKALLRSCTEGFVDIAIYILDNISIDLTKTDTNLFTEVFGYDENIDIINALLSRKDFINVDKIYLRVCGTKNINILKCFNKYNKVSKKIISKGFLSLSNTMSDECFNYIYKYKELINFGDNSTVEKIVNNIVQISPNHEIVFYILSKINRSVAIKICTFYDLLEQYKYIYDKEDIMFILITSSKCNSVKILSHFIQYSLGSFDNLLDIACEYNSNKIVEMLLNKNENKGVAFYMLEKSLKSNNRTIYSDQYKTCKLLLNTGKIDTTYKDSLCLKLAIQTSNVEIVKLILLYDVDPSIWIETILKLGFENNNILNVIINDKRFIIPNSVYHNNLLRLCLSFSCDVYLDVYQKIINLLKERKYIDDYNHYYQEEEDEEDEDEEEYVEDVINNEYDDDDLEI